MKLGIVGRRSMMLRIDKVLIVAANGCSARVVAGAHEGLQRVIPRKGKA